MAKHQPITTKLARQKFLRFVFSAGAGFLVDIGVYYFLYNHWFTHPHYNLLHYPVSNSVLSLSISFFMGVLVNFIITRYLVFAESKLSAGQQFIRFGLVAVVGFFANLLVLKLFINYLHLYPPVARVITSLSLFLASFFVHKVFSFNLSLRHHAKTHH